MKKTSKKLPLCSYELEALMSKNLSKLQVANKDDIRIIDDYSKIRKMLSEVRHEIYRDIIRENKLKKLSPKMKDIHRMENELINRLKEK